MSGHEEVPSVGDDANVAADGILREETAELTYRGSKADEPNSFGNRTDTSSVHTHLLYTSVAYNVKAAENKAKNIGMHRIR